MRTDIPSDLKNKLTANGATPIYYLIFHFDSGDVYISDRQMYTQGGHLTQNLLSGIKNIRQSAALDEAVNNLLISNAEVSISLINTSATGWFCSKINENPIENTRVSLYLTSSDSVGELLIDEYLIRDPIEYSEDSSFVELTLVTGVLAQNVTVGSIDPATHEYYSLRVGAATVTNGSPYGNQKFAQLTNDIDSGSTVITTDRDLATAGFPSTGYLSLGSATCIYSNISGKNFLGVNIYESGFTLAKDSYICQLNNDITFAYGTGPVDIAEPLYVDGELYPYDYTTYKNENPVKVVFPDSLPYRVETKKSTINIGDSLTHSEYLDKNYDVAVYDDYDESSSSVHTYSTKTNGGAWNNRLMFKKALSLNHTFPSGAKILKTNINLEVDIYGYSGSSYISSGYSKLTGKLNGRDISIQSGVPYSSGSWGAKEVLYDSDNWTKSPSVLNDPNQNYFKIEMSGFSFVPPVVSFIVKTSIFYKFSMSVTYEVDAPGYPKKIYTVTTSLNVGGSTGTVNPSTFIQSICKQQSPNLQIDQQSFDNCYDWFDTNDYSFAGVIDGGMYCLDLLKQLLFMSRSYLTFAGGYVKLHIAQLPATAEAKIISTEDSRLPKSVKIKRQPTDDILNYITLRYDYNTNTELYDNAYVSSVQDSIDLLGIHETTIDGWLITDSNHAQSLTDYWLSEKSVPKTVFSIKETARMTGIEVGDSVIVKTSYSDIRYFTGTVIKFDISPGDKDNITTFSLTLSGKLNPPPKVIELSDAAIDVTESGIIKPHINLSDTLDVTETAVAKVNVGWSVAPWSITPWSNTVIEGTLWTVGFNSYGQLGDGTTTNKSTPIQLDNSFDWISISAGKYYTVAVKTDGTLWAWGANDYGQLGDGTTTDRHTPTQIGTGTTWSKVSCGDTHTVAIKTDGTLWAWGNNVFGRLGDGTTTDRHTPTQIGTGTTWSKVSCGLYHTVATRTDGTLWAWGLNVYGQLGDGTTTDRHTPTQIGTGTTWSKVSCGYGHSIAIKTNGTLWAWGYNGSGELGDNTTTSRYSPTQIGTGTTWSVVSCGYGFTLATKTDGTLWAWGNNTSGKLGDGTVVYRYLPTQIGTGTTWSKVSCGYDHSVATKTDSSLWTWGNNNFGQLGDGTTTSRYIPTRIKPEFTWELIDGGGSHSVFVEN